MRRKATNALIRRNLSLSEGAIKLMGALRLATQSSSDSGVVCQALTALEQYNDDTEEGISLRIVHPDGRRLEIVPDMFASNDESVVRQKVNMVLHDEADQRIDTLRTRIGAASDSEVVRAALKLYDLLVHEYQAGGDLELLYPDGENRLVRFMGVARRPQNNRVALHAPASVALG